MKLLHVPIEKDGPLVAIEVPDEHDTDVSGGAFEPVARRTPDTSSFQSLSDALAGAGPVLRVIRDRVASVLGDAEELTVSIGLKVGANAGIVLASASTEATVNLTLKWKRENG